jgi:hypothetical protein
MSQMLPNTPFIPIFRPNDSASLGVACHGLTLDHIENITLDLHILETQIAEHFLWHRIDGEYAI